MAASIFDVKTVEPSEQMLITELGKSKVYLDQIAFFIEKEYGGISHEWKYYGNKSGWILKLYSKKRNILFVIPCHGYFRISFTFSEKPVHEIMQHELPGFNKQDLLDSRKYAEGRTFQYDVKNDSDYSNVTTFIQIKMNH